LKIRATDGDEHAIPGLVEGRNFFGTHPQELFTISRGWRPAGESHANDSLRDYLGNGQTKFHGLSGEMSGATTATMWHELMSP
jgi:hypothetical protein